MTREQDSDSTLPPEGEKRRLEIPSAHWSGERGDMLDPQHGECVQRPVISPREVVCSFCGVATHGHKDCLVMHQYIREQADALTQRRLEEYHQLQEWARYESPKRVPPGQEARKIFSCVFI